MPSSNPRVALYERYVKLQQELADANTEAYRVLFGSGDLDEFSALEHRAKRLRGQCEEIIKALTAATSTPR